MHASTSVFFVPPNACLAAPTFFPPPFLTDSELGLGTTAVTNIATQVPPARVANKVATSICAGKRHSCAVFSDRTVRLWPWAMRGLLAGTQAGLRPRLGPPCQ
jgi:hypothetical protein